MNQQRLMATSQLNIIALSKTPTVTMMTEGKLVVIYEKSNLSHQYDTIPIQHSSKLRTKSFRNCYEVVPSLPGRDEYQSWIGENIIASRKTHFQLRKPVLDSTEIGEKKTKITSIKNRPSTGGTIFSELTALYQQCKSSAATIKEIEATKQRYSKQHEEIQDRA